MSIHLRAAWASRIEAAQPTVTLYHGTNQAALSLIRSLGFQALDPEDVAHEIEGRYDLPRDSVWNSKFNTFGNFRKGDTSVYFTQQQEVAEEYAAMGSEVVFDALSAAYIVKFHPFDEDGNYRSGEGQAKQQWVKDEARKNYPPVVLTLEAPWEEFKRIYMRRNGYEPTVEEFTGGVKILMSGREVNYPPHTTIALIAPVPATWIKSTRKLSLRVAGRDDDIPPEPGQSRLPPGTVRGFHYTDANNLNAVRREGLLLKHARGHVSQEPDAIWFSGTNSYWKGDPSTVLLEVAVPPKTIAIGGTATNFALVQDVPASWIIAIHEAWHSHYRYLMANDPGGTRAGDHDSLINDKEYGPAIRRIKSGR